MITHRWTPALLVAGALLWASGVQAQHSVFGVRGGLSVAGASLDIQETVDESNRTGYTAGIFYDYASSGLLGFQIAAQYTQKGNEFDAGSAIDNIDLAYLEIPAVVKLGLPLGPIRPSAYGGVALGFNASCDTGGEDCGDEVKGTEFSGVAGADLAIYIGGLSLWADARYHFGLNDISDAVDIDSYKTRTWLLQVGLGF